MSSQDNLKICQEVTSTSIYLKWEDPPDKKTFEYFEIKYRDIKNESNFNHKQNRQTDENEFKLRYLKSDTNYEIKVFISRKDGRMELFFNIECRTEPSHLSELFQISDKVNDDPPIYKLPCIVIEKTKDFLRECHILEGYQQPDYKDGSSGEKTILVVGGTGSGKSTFIDAMVNHVVEVSFGDMCRFKVIDLPENEKHKTEQQVVSQTNITTCYRIPRRNGFSIKFSLNIIDTPGFDDTRGKSFDKQIPEQIRHLFEHVVHSVHAVCIITPISNARLTDAQKWIFSSISKLFGANIKNNIYPCITFDDLGQPKCLDALKESSIPFSKHFRFSNSDLFQASPSIDQFERRSQSFDDFFSEIDDVLPVCLKDSINVMRKRNEITIQLTSIQDKIRIQVQTVNTLKQLGTNYQSFKSSIQCIPNFTYEEIVPTKTRNKSKKKSVNCTACEESCHKECSVPFDLFLFTCEAFSDGKCKICKNKCPKDKHVREDYEIKTVLKNKTRTSEDWKKILQDQLDKNETVLENDKLGLSTSLQDLRDMLQHVNELIETLNEIALKTEHYSTENYLQELIDLESKNQEAGFQERIDFISKMKTTLEANKQLEDVMEELSI